MPAPDVRVRGDRLTDHRLRGLSVTQKVNQRTTADIDTLWFSDERELDCLELEDESGVILLEDGSGCIALDADARRRLPRFGDALSVDLPDTTYRQRVLDRAPALYWAMDERPGKVLIRDWSGNGNHGMIAAVLPAQGPGLRARAGRLAAVPYGAAPNMVGGTILRVDERIAGRTTIQVWLDLSNLNPPAADAPVMQFPGVTSGVFVLAAGGLRIRFGAGNPFLDIPHPGPGWHMLTLVLDALDLRAYTDGVLAGSATLAATIGHEQGPLGFPTGDYWADELSVENEVRTAPEIAADYAARNHLRIFQGICLDPEVRGEERLGDAHVRVSGAGQGIWLERAMVTEPIATGAALPVADFFETLLPIDAGLSTDGVPWPISAGRQVYSLETLADVFRSQAEAVGGDMWVEPWGEIRVEPFSGFRADGTRFDGSNCSEATAIDDSQHLRTRQVLVGAGGTRGESSEWFSGDGTKTVFGPLQYPPDNIIDIQLDGVSEPWSGPNPTWVVSTRDFTLTRRIGAPPAPTGGGTGPNGENIVIRYRSDFPIIAEVQSTDGQRLYGLWTRADEDRTADTVPLALERARTRLGRHDTPTKRLTLTTLRGAMGPIRPGVLARCHFPITMEIDELDMLVDSVTTEIQEGGDAELIHQVELTAGDYESRSIDYLKQIGRITTPLARRRQVASGVNVITIDPTDASFEGVVLPVDLGGSHTAPNKKQDGWAPIAGGAITLLNGRALASLRGAMILTLNARAEPPTDGAQWQAAVRLYDRTNARAIGAALAITAPARALYFIPRLALAQETAEYEVQYRITYGGSNRRRPLLWVHSATLTAGTGGSVG